MRWIALACLAAAAAWPCVAGAEDLSRVSCRDKGKVVYLANVRRDAVPAATASALAEFPGALCVALGPEPPPEAPAATAPGDIASVLAGATSASPLTTGNSGLDAALHALRGDAMLVTVPAPVPVPVPTPAPTEGVVYKAVNYDAILPARPDWARIAVYSDADVDVALGDWDRIVSADPVTFASLTPDIRVSGDTVLLGAGPVRPGERDGFCLAASTLSLDCGFGGAAARAETEEALAMAGHDAPPSSSGRVPSLDTEADAACPGATVGHMACWASPFALAEADALPSPPFRVPASEAEPPPPPPPVAAPPPAEPPRRAPARRGTRKARVAGR